MLTKGNGFRAVGQGGNGVFGGTLEGVDFGGLSPDWRPFSRVPSLTGLGSSLPGRLPRTHVRG